MVQKTIFFVLGLYSIGRYDIMNNENNKESMNGNGVR